MIPILYPASVHSENDLISYGDGFLAETISATVKRVLNGIDELEIRYPLKGRRAANLELSKVILAQPEYQTDAQPYRIYDIQKQSDGIIIINARHIKEQLSYIPVLPYSMTGVTAAQAFEEARNYTGESSSDFTFWTDIATTADFTMNQPVSMLNLLGGVEGSLLDVFGGEYEFDGWTIKLWQRRGADNGVEIRYGKNLISAKVDDSTEGVITGICPFWADMDGNLITLPEKVVSIGKAANYPFNRTVIKDCTEAFENAPTEAQLRAYAQAYLARTGTGDIQQQMDIKFEQLAAYEEYKIFGVNEKVNLGDTVKIIYSDLGLDASARVVGTTYDVLEERYTGVSLGKIRYNLNDVLNELK